MSLLCSHCLLWFRRTLCLSPYVPLLRLYKMHLSMLHTSAVKILYKIVFLWILLLSKIRIFFKFLWVPGFPPCLFFCLCDFPSELGITFCKNLHAVYFSSSQKLTVSKYALFSHKTHVYSFFCLGITWSLSGLYWVCTQNLVCFLFLFFTSFVLFGLVCSPDCKVHQ